MIPLREKEKKMDIEEEICYKCKKRFSTDDDKKSL